MILVNYGHHAKPLLKTFDRAKRSLPALSYELVNQRLNEKLLVEKKKSKCTAYAFHNNNMQKLCEKWCLNFSLFFVYSVS